MATGAAISRLRLWWRRRDPSDRRVIGASAIAAVLLSLLFFSSRSRSQREQISSGSESYPPLVDLTLLENAENGAVCLDGSPPAYHFQRGFGSGSDNWVVHLEGGGWCNSDSTCSMRKFTKYGSSHYMKRQEAFVGILSNMPTKNPDFYNWNRVKIRYCDGASFSGYVEGGLQNKTGLFFRGQRIWEAMMSELLLKGLSSAKQALLTGCSAGGLATYIHCDDFRALVPKEAKVKCMADGGFFLDAKDISGKRFIRSFYNDVVHLQDVGKRFPDCISRMDPVQCFFAQEIIKKIKTPFFIVNPAYDYWQVQHVLAPEESDPGQSWLRCKLNVKECDAKQMESLQEFRSTLLNALSEFKRKKNGGMFINSCFAHCQTMDDITWHSPNSPRINNKTIAEAVGDWYFNRRKVKEIDCAYPCNPTCYNLNFTSIYPLLP